MPLAVGACKKAWATLLEYCKLHHDKKSKAGCAAFQADPASFLVPKVLRAKINPIDAVYKCASSVSHSQWPVGPLLILAWTIAGRSRMHAAPLPVTHRCCAGVQHPFHSVSAMCCT